MGTHTNAIIMQIARTNELCPKTNQTDEETLVNMDMIREELKDFYNFTTGLTYMGNISRDTIEEYVKMGKNKLMYLERIFQSKWMLGENLTFLDFMAYDIIDHQQILFPRILNEFTKIKLFMDNFEELEPIKDFLKSDRYKKFPLWSERSFLGRNEETLPN